MTFSSDGVGFVSSVPDERLVQAGQRWEGMPELRVEVHRVLAFPIGWFLPAFADGPATDPRLTSLLLGEADRLQRLGKTPPFESPVEITLPRFGVVLVVFCLQWDSPIGRTWRKGIAAAQAFAAGRDNSLRDVPKSWEHDGTALGGWLTARRRELRDGKLTGPRRAELDAIDPAWHLSSAEIWDAHYNAARAFHRRHGHLRPDADHRAAGELDLPRWLEAQRSLRSSGLLTPQREERLTAIGMPWTLSEDNWRRGLAIAAQYVAEHGDLDVPRKDAYQGFPLGAWLTNHRKQVGTGRLRAERMTALNALDPAWHTHRDAKARWDRRYQAARAYAEKHGHLPRRGSPAPEGTDFRKWLVQQRQDARSGLLTADRIAKLNALDPAWRNDHRSTRKENRT